MSKLPPYEQWDEQWSDGLDLPDADKAWGDMKDKLDAEDRKRRFGFFLPLLPCAGWTLLGLAVLGAGTWLLWPSADKPAAAPAATERTAVPDAPADAAANNTATAGKRPLTRNPTVPGRPAGDGAATGTTTTDAPAVATTTNAATPSTNASTPTKTATRLADGPRGTAIASHNGDASATPTRPASSSNGPKQNTTTARKPNGSGTTAARRSDTATGTARISTVGSPSGPKPATTRSMSADGASASTDTAIAIPSPQAAVRMQQPAGTTDSSSTAQTPAPAVAPPDSNAAAAPVLPKKKGVKGWSFSAGLALHEALSVNGANVWMKDYRGRSNPITEHVPALWLRAERGRWSLTAEARFHAPQYVPELIFAQKTRWDTGGHAVLTQRDALRKVWYHHFGATVGFRVWKGWSIGAGAQYSLLHQAYAERRYIWSDYSGNIQSVNAEARPIKGFRDTFLYKTQWQVLLQTEYNWKRWSLGLRYRADLEPYIRYTRPGGAVADKRNDAVEAILRFRLWQSGGKKK
ncbi:MAG: hypothetical protein EOO16_08090 [Chitinophagaceae bacterium]|nr:MAG: hypothetical protein EOO16_08090 [Chitinophagaceae bacterium]